MSAPRPEWVKPTPAEAYRAAIRDLPVLDRFGHAPSLEQVPVTLTAKSRPFWAAVVAWHCGVNLEPPSRARRGAQ